MATKKTKSAVVTAKLKVLGKTHSATGETVAEAINNLKPGNCKGKSVLSIEQKGSVKERILMPITISRLFNSSGLARDISLKQIAQLF